MVRRDVTSRLRESTLLAGAAAALLAAACGRPFAISSGTGGTSMTGGSGGGGTATATATASSGGGSSSTTSTSGTGGQGTGGSAPAAIAIVQATPTQLDEGEDPSLSLPATPTAGNAIIVGITCFSEVDNCTIPQGGVTDNQGNTYVRAIEGSSIVSSTTHGARGYIFIAENITVAGDPFTITVNPNGSYPENFQHFTWGAIEVSGLATNSLDQTGVLANTCCPTSTTVTTAAATAQPNELAVAINTIRSNDDNVNYGHDPTWVEHHVASEGVSHNPHSMVTKIVSATGNVSHTWTHDAPTRGVSAVIATFRGAAGASP